MLKPFENALLTSVTRSSTTLLRRSPLPLTEYSSADVISPFRLIQVPRQCASFSPTSTSLSKRPRRLRRKRRAFGQERASSFVIVHVTYLLWGRVLRTAETPRYDGLGADGVLHEMRRILARYTSCNILTSRRVLGTADSVLKQAT